MKEIDLIEQFHDELKPIMKKYFDQDIRVMIVFQGENYYITGNGCPTCAKEQLQEMIGDEDRDDHTISH